MLLGSRGEVNTKSGGDGTGFPSVCKTGSGLSTRCCGRFDSYSPPPSSAYNGRSTVSQRH